MPQDTAYNRLRETAERIVRKEAVALTEEEKLDLLRLAHELELARIELETQNEELRRTSRSLEAVSREYLDLYEAAPVAYLALSPKGIITRANATAREILTDPDAGPLGWGFSHFVRPKDHSRYFRTMRKQAASHKYHTFELELVGRGNRSLQAHIQVIPKYDPAGKFQFWHLAFFDISELRRREAELQQVHAQLAMAAKAASLGTWNYDLDQGTTKWDRGLYRLLGLKPREGPEDGNRFFEFILPEDRTGILENLQVLLGTDGDDIREDFRVVRADGEIRWLAARGRVFRDAQGRPRRIAGINYDITARKQAEESVQLAQMQLARQLAETERSNEELRQYAYAVSHDLKAPLRAVRNYADFLYEDLAGTLTGEQKAYLEGMKKAVQQGDDLIDDLLNLSRLDQMAIEKEPADVPAIVSEVGALLGEADDLEIEVTAQWPEFHADHMVLKQILHNLISNAAKFNRRNPRRITVGWQPASGEGLELFVRDNGIGIAPHYHEQIFRIFQRLHTEQEYDGTGIGLAIVRKAAHKLGGEVRLESEVDKGSTFFVRLPGG